MQPDIAWTTGFLLGRLSGKGVSVDAVYGDQVTFPDGDQGPVEYTDRLKIRLPMQDGPDLIVTVQVIGMEET